MSGFVLDGSVTLSWCFPDESEPYAQDFLNSLAEMDAHVAAI